ncbi:DsbA family protein [Kribbella monticola]|uniref:DsbA family protein n=1 Tax=Kribbella monticola TaxID=2185285 RepID=UPI001E5E11A3|nr:thioredoxin domain-containing protein [Kribbella monticola]
MSNPLLQERRRRISPGIVVVVVLVLAIVAAVGVDYWRKHSKVEVTANGRPEPAVITGPGTDGKGITIGKTGAKSNIDLYLDFRCPHCEEFETATGATLDKLVEDGTATITYWPLAFVSPEDSPRLANAFAASAANGKALSFVDAVYGDFSKAWTTDQLMQLGTQLGINDAKYQAAVNGNSYAGWLDSISNASTDRKVTGTPTAFVNGKQVDPGKMTPDGIKAAVESSS